MPIGDAGLGRCTAPGNLPELEDYYKYPRKRGNQQLLFECLITGVLGWAQLRFPRIGHFIDWAVLVLEFSFVLKRGRGELGMARSMGNRSIGSILQTPRWRDGQRGVCKIRFSTEAYAFCLEDGLCSAFP